MYDIMQKYISITQKELQICMKIILEKEYDKTILNEYIQTYINIRYHNFVDDKTEGTLRIKILNALKTVRNKINEENVEERQKNEYTYMFFIYMLYFDKVIICKDKKAKIEKIEKLKQKVLKKSDENFKTELYKTITEFENQKEELLSKLESKEFYIKVSSYPNVNNVYRTILKYDIKFPMIYSEKAIEKAFETGITNEDKLFIEYYIVTGMVIQDVIKQKMKKQYIVDFADTLLEKNKKLDSLLKVISSPSVQEKINLKIRYTTFIKYKEKIYELMRRGFKIAVVLDESFEVSFKNMENLNIFSYIIISKKLKRYEEIMQDKVMLNHIIEV